MDPIERKIRIATPVEHAWRVFTDIDKLPERLDHVLSVTRLDGPPFDVGTRWRHTTRPPPALTGARNGAAGPGQGLGGPQPPSQVSAVVEVIGCERHSFYALSIGTAIGKSVYAYEFTQVAPEMTEVRAIAQMQPEGLRSRIMIWALRRVLTRAISKALEHLLGEMQRLCERLHQQSGGL